MPTIRPNRPSESSRLEYCTLDIENNPDGSVICILLYDGKDIKWFQNWAEYHLFIVKQTERRFLRVYAHNGGGWDWLSYVDWLLVNPWAGDIGGIITGTRLIAISMLRLDGKKIDMLDSLCLFWDKLDTVAWKFAGRRKVNIEGRLPHVLLKEDPEKFREYAEADVVLLYDSIRCFHELIREKVCKIPTLGITLASTAMLLWRTMYEGPKIETPEAPELRANLRKAYRGGWVECFKPGYYEDIKVYDVNSMYPAVMMDTPMPITGGVVWMSKFRHQEGVASWWECEVKRSVYGLPPGKHFLSGYEVDALCSKQRAYITTSNGFAFREHYPIFNEYTSTLYRLRQENGSNALGSICKLLLNSLYGKFGQSPTRESLVRVESFEDLQRKVENDNGLIYDIDPERGVYSVEKESPAIYEHVGIAATITSSARVRLLSLFNEGTVYCDTDSVHTTDIMPDCIIGKELGKVKLEHRGEGVYVGKKLYGLRKVADGEQKVKIRVKGVKVGGVGGCEVSFDDLLTLLDGGAKVCKFVTPATPREVWAGKRKPCILDASVDGKVVRTRTIRRLIND